MKSIFHFSKIPFCMANDPLFFRRSLFKFQRFVQTLFKADHFKYSLALVNNFLRKQLFAIVLHL